MPLLDLGNHLGLECKVSVDFGLTEQLPIDTFNEAPLRGHRVRVGNVVVGDRRKPAEMCDRVQMSQIRGRVDRVIFGRFHRVFFSQFAVFSEFLFGFFDHVSLQVFQFLIRLRLRRDLAR